MANPIPHFSPTSTQLSSLQVVTDQDTPNTTGDDTQENEGVACVLCFNASDPCGASGTAADMLTVACVGAHPMPIITGVYARDTAEISEYFHLGEDAVDSQARAVLEDEIGRAHV